MMKVDIELSLPVGATAPAMARRFLRGLREYVPSATYDTVELLVSELVTNSFRHAGLSDTDSIELAIRATDHTVRVEVADPGPGFVVRARDGSSPQGSGWGLYLVERLASKWGVAQDDGNRVWFELDCEPPSPVDKTRVAEDSGMRTERITADRHDDGLVPSRA